MQRARVVVLTVLRLARLGILAGVLAFMFLSAMGQGSEHRAGGALSDVMLERRLTALEVTMETNTAVLRGLVGGVGTLVLEMLLRWLPRRKG